MRMRFGSALAVVALTAALPACGPGGYYGTVVDRHISMLKGDSVEDRANAAWSLGELGARANPAVPALIEAMSDVEPEVRAQAAGALGSIGKGAVSSLTILSKALEDTDAEVRASAASWRSRLGQKPYLLCGARWMLPENCPNR